MDRKLPPAIRIMLVVLVCLLFATSLLYAPTLIDTVLAPKVFWLYTIVGLLSITLLIGYSWGRSLIVVQFNSLDLWLLGFYLLCAISFVWHGMEAQRPFAIQTTLTAVYIIFRILFAEDKSLFVRSAMLGLFCAGIGQLLIGLLQVAGHLPYMSAGFIVAGTFGNPGPYAIFIAVLFSFGLPWALWSKLRAISLIAIGGCLLAAFMLPVAGSRTSWIAVFVALVLLSAITNKRFLLFLSDRVWKRVGIMMMFCIVSLSLIYYLADIRRESADGRIFIWSNALEIIQDYPLLGVGYAQFQSYYPDYQAAYFQTHPEDKTNGYLAGDISNAFNEYLELATELGVVGLAVFLIFFTSLIYHGCRVSVQDRKDPALLGALTCIVTILIAAFFSYPFQSVSIMLCFYFAAALVASYTTSRSYSITIAGKSFRLFAIAGLAAISYGGYMLWLQYDAEVKWSRAVYTAKSAKWEEAKELYKDIYPILDNNPAFLFNYGAELSANGEFNKSIPLLMEAEKSLKSTDIYTYLGNSYLGIGDFLKAEDCYLKASQIIPHKLFPKYQLVNLYNETGQTDKANHLANDIIEMHIKVHSEMAIQIKEEMKFFVQNQIPR